MNQICEEKIKLHKEGLLDKQQRGLNLIKEAIKLFGGDFSREIPTYYEKTRDLTVFRDRNNCGVCVDKFRVEFKGSSLKSFKAYGVKENPWLTGISLEINGG